MVGIGVKLLVIVVVSAWMSGGQAQDEATPPGAATSEPVQSEPERSERDLPDILFITVDTTRADHLGCYGYFRDTSPVLDALASNSIQFERCVVPVATTLPSHLSLFTGTYPVEHGVLANVRRAKEHYVVSPNVKLFAEIAQAAGYSTAGFISGAPLKPHSGIHAGFDVYSAPEEGRRSAEETNARVFEWLDDEPKSPFFLWVHYFDPHAPCSAPEPFAFQTDPALEAYLADRKFADSTRRKETDHREDLVIETRHAINQYDAAIRYMDHHIGQLCQRLKAAGTLDDAIIIVIGDHGEGLNQHSEPGHGGIWQEQMLVPFLLRVPGERARKISTTVSSVDVLPTLLNLVSIPGGDMLIAQCSGQNLLDPRYRSRPAYSQTPLFSESEQRTPPAAAIQTNEWRLIRREGEHYELYHIARDPHELVNVFDRNRRVAQRLIRRLKAEQERQLEKAKLLTPAGSERAPDKVLEQLESLGYVGDDE